MELQNLHDRVPPRGAAIATISQLLDSCRTAHQLRPIRSPFSNQKSVHFDKGTNTAVFIDVKQNGNGIPHLSITDEKCAVVSILKSVDDRHMEDIEEESPFINLPLECMCTCGVMDTSVEHSSNQLKCLSHYGSNTNELLNQQIDQNDKRCNELVASCTCEYCPLKNNKLNVTEASSSKCDCTHSCSVHLVNKSNESVKIVSDKGPDDDGDDIASDNNEISFLMSKPETYDKIGLNISDSFENTEAEAAHVQPATPSPIISISSGTTGGDDDRVNRDIQTPSLVSPIENDDEKLSTGNNISPTTDASGASTSTGNGAGKRGKTDAKLALDLNDTSKYTKEVSV